MRLTPFLYLAILAGLAGAAMAALGDNPKTLTTAPHRLDISKPSRNGLFKRVPALCRFSCGAHASHLHHPFPG